MLFTMLNCTEKALYSKYTFTPNQNDESLDTVQLEEKTPEIWIPHPSRVLNYEIIINYSTFLELTRRFRSVEHVKLMNLLTITNTSCGMATQSRLHQPTTRARIVMCCALSMCTRRKLEVEETLQFDT